MVETNEEVLQKSEAKEIKEAPKKAVKSSSVAKTPASNGQLVAKTKKFLTGAWAELKKVTWPNRQDLINYTLVVLVTVAIVGTMIFVVDSVLSKILEAIIPK